MIWLYVHAPRTLAVVGVTFLACLLSYVGAH